MGDVTRMPGAFRRGHRAIPADDVLRQATGQNLADVVVIGRFPSGELYVAASCADTDLASGIAARGLTFLSEDDEIVEED